MVPKGGSCPLVKTVQIGAHLTSMGTYERIFGHRKTDVGMAGYVPVGEYDQSPAAPIGGHVAVKLFGIYTSLPIGIQQVQTARGVGVILFDVVTAAGETALMVICCWLVSAQPLPSVTMSCTW